ncbi:MAG: signal recognition particle-docking protein FtsY [Candidatus Amoebophilus sp. 36-38]|nr:MAG: signal recognition particle-docking protein FtsY [Candidatus Amoebophilus sp. 36-38]
MGIFNFFSKKSKEKLGQALSPTKTSFWTSLNKVLVGKSTIDDEILDNLEELLLTADIGIDTTLKIINHLEERVARDKYVHVAELEAILREEIESLINLKESSSAVIHAPHIILVVGVNGVGKTTSIGKLAALYKQAGKQVVLGAADTFRAAAIEQLKRWGDRVGIPVVAHAMHTDPSAVAYETVQKAIQSQADVVIIDTAGRLHTKVNLMHELSKIRRTIEKLVPSAPHEVLLVLDATTGQNAFVQTKAFTEATAVTGLVVTKLDGTAKGGVVIGIIDQFHIPVRYMGVGEQVDDLQPFDGKAFVDTLFKQ